MLTRLPERPFRPADPRTANRAFQQRRQFDRATPLSDRGDFGAAFWAQAGQNTPLVGARYPHSPSLGSGGAARRPRRNSQHIVRRNGALSRPSPKRNGAPNTCPDYCAFPGCSLSVREGSVRVVTPWNTRTPAPSPSLGSITSATTGRRPGLIDSVERPQIGIHASLDRVARHKDPRNCDSPLSSRCDSV